jgi:hypothetical protein
MALAGTDMFVMNTPQNKKTTRIWFARGPEKQKSNVMHVLYIHMASDPHHMTRVQATVLT